MQEKNAEQAKIIFEADKLGYNSEVRKMIKLNRQRYLDKLHACWLGKNIGGTLGAPYEGKRAFLDITDFATKKGENYPNDDLDLQLIWLAAIEEVGPSNFSANTLAEFWLDWIPPHCNEYGIAKSNLRVGLLPPMSGEIDNDKWKTSNGAWIRSERWASLCPGVVDAAVKYAVMDAMVDHGLNEGTYAEIFTATIESAAYVESDIRKLIECGLKKIPEDCMVAKTVRLVIDCYDKGVEYREAREKVVEFNKELGWFQAPGNLGFVAIGLLYGEGDFRKSVLYAINCGDDTDCTGATVGSVMGIIGGTESIPEEWKEFVGDKIVTAFINSMYGHRIPKTCTNLKDRVAALVPSVMRANRVSFGFIDGVDEVSAEDFEAYNQLTSADFLNRSPYSYDITDAHPFSVMVEMDKTPRVTPGEERKIKLSFTCSPNVHEQRKLQLRVIVPETWEAGYCPKTLALDYAQPGHKIYGKASVEFTIRAGEKIDVTNRAYVEVTSQTLPYSVMIPVVFIG